MKSYKKLLVVAALIGGVSLTSQADAARDYLFMAPGAPEGEPLTAIQEKVIVEAPNQELKETLDEFTAFNLKMADKKFILLSDKVISGQQLDVDTFLFYMRVRIQFYKGHHRWVNHSYGTTTLFKMYEDYKEYLTANPYLTEANADKFKADMLDIIEGNAAGVHLNELRTYMNEAVIFALEQTIKESNVTVKEYKDRDVKPETKLDPVVNVPVMSK